MYEPFYSQSRALVIGINRYKDASPLAFARADAEGVAQVLIDDYKFPEANVCLLMDLQATRAAISEAFFNLRSSDVDDRIVVFFAGHGHTEQSRRGEVGFLVPADGKVGSLASLIRWDDLTRGADFIPAKHVLFLMDACYGGLAITRRLKAGSMRFLHDMARRHARQVLTAGKANEVVSDLGGPLPGHSPFTGHLIEGLRGRAKSADGVLTANGLMGYVYQSVSQDDRCQQTPHYGYAEGDGDFVWAPVLEPPSNDEAKGQTDTLVSLPSTLEETDSPMSLVAQTKEYLGDPRFSVKLHDLLATEIRRVLSLTASDQFEPTKGWNESEFPTRIERYNQSLEELLPALAVLGYWAAETNRTALALPVKRLSDRLVAQSGNTGWLALRWYPALTSAYAIGMSAVAARRYDNLFQVFNASVNPRLENDSGSQRFVTAVARGISDVAKAFNLLPGHERKYAPLSEYLHQLLQPILDDTVFVGSDYEAAFDEFEMLYAIEYMHRCMVRENNFCFPPVGRFGWKGRWPDDTSPLRALMSEADRLGAAWPPIAAGFCDGSFERFHLVAARTQEQVSRLPWH